MKNQKGFIEKWRTETVSGIKYGCHILSANGKISDTPGQTYSTRSGRRKWINKIKKDSPLLEERNINPPKK